MNAAMEQGIQIFGLEFAIGFAVTSVIGGFLSSKVTGNRIALAITAYIGQMTIGTFVAIFGYLLANLIASVGGFVWSDTRDWQVGRWMTFVFITAFYAKNVWEARQWPELKPGLVVGRCGSNPRNWK